MATSNWVILGIILIVVAAVVIYFLWYVYRPPDGRCTSNTDCPTGLICNAGKCLTPQACTSDTQCSPDVCINRICVQCRDNSNCQGSTPICFNNSCVACTQTSQCGANQTCINNVCASCSQDADCPYGQTCDSGICTVQTCSADGDCQVVQGGSGICLNGACLQKYCNNPSDCSSGEACINNLCYPVGGSCSSVGSSSATPGATSSSITGSTVTPSSSSVTPTATSSSGTCYNGVMPCVSGTCQQCQTNSQCPAGQACSNGACVNTNCPGGYTEVNRRSCCVGGGCGQTCSSSNQCTGSCSHCVSGVCDCQPADTGGTATESCIDNLSCPSGSRCAVQSQLPFNVCVRGTCIFSSGLGPVGIYTCPATGFYCVSSDGTQSGSFNCSQQPLGAFCDSNADCGGSGLRCINNVCRNAFGGYGELCYTDSNIQPCISGLTCRESDGSSSGTCVR